MDKQYSGYNFETHWYKMKENNESMARLFTLKSQGRAVCVGRSYNQIKYKGNLVICKTW